MRERPRVDGSSAGTSASAPGTFAVEFKNGDGCALLVVDTDGEVTSVLSHWSLQYGRLGGGGDERMCGPEGGGDLPVGEDWPAADKANFFVHAACADRGRLGESRRAVYEGRLEERAGVI